MFTGIIKSQTKIKKMRSHGDSIRMQFSRPRGWKIRAGESISIDGMCSTVAQLTAGSFDVDYMPETVKKTNVRHKRVGDTVNLERSLKYGSRVEGHFVLGHVDTSVPIKKIVTQSISKTFELSIPKPFRRFVVLHESIAINGVSLTVCGKKGSLVRVSLIPHTLAHTNLGSAREGSFVNIEVDCLARYGIAPLSTGGTVQRNAAKRIREKKKDR